MLSFELMKFPLFSPLFVLFSPTLLLLSVLLFIHGRAGCSFQSKRGGGEEKRTEKKPPTTVPSSNWPRWRLETTRGSKRYEDNRGFIKMFSSLPEERAVRTGWEGGKGNHLAQTTLTKKEIQANHLWSPWKLACNPSSHLLMKPQSPFINLLKNLFSEDS